MSRELTWRALLLVAGLCASANSWAWGSEGHRLVGYVADADLSPRARIATRRIMKADSLASVANWMDEVRGTPEGNAMQRWHFVTIKVCGHGQMSCKNGNCAPGRIEWARDVLRTGTPEEALKALRVQVHLVADVHQPLHAADNGDYGGNGGVVLSRLCVEFGKADPSACKLHTYWDNSLVKTAIRGQSEQAAAAAWVRDFGALPPTDSDQAADWAMESFELARRTAYGFEGFSCKQKHLSFAATEQYDLVGVETVQQQIVKAGRRLARTLNMIFD